MSSHQLISSRACRRIGHVNSSSKMTSSHHYLTTLVNVIGCCVAFLTVTQCFAQQTTADSQRKSIVLRTLQQILSTGNHSMLSVQETDAILPVGEAFNLFQSYGLLAFNVNVAPLILVSTPNSRAIGNGSPTPSPFTLPLFQMTTHPVLDQKLYTPEIRRPHMNIARGHQQLMEVMDRSVRLHLCRDTEALMIRFLSGFTVDGLSKPWWAFAAAWKKHVLPRIYGVPATYLSDDYIFLLVRIEKRSIVGSINGSMLLEPDLLAKLPSPDAGGKLDAVTKPWRSAVEFFVQFGTHVITDYSVGDALFQVIVYDASSLPLLSEKMLQLRAHVEQFNPVNATKLDWNNLLLKHSTPVHVGKLQLISGNRTLINWLESRLAVSTLPETIPSSIRLLGAPVLFNLFYRQMQPRAVLSMNMAAITKAIPEMSLRTWLDDILINLLRMWEYNM